MEVGIKYELDTPRGTLTFEPDGATMGLRLLDITGLGGPPLRTASEPAPMQDRSLVHPSYDTARFPVVNGQTLPMDLTTRRQRLDTIVACAESIRREDGVLRFSPTGDDPRRLTVRLFGPVEIGGTQGPLKTFQIPLIAPDPRVYSDTEVVVGPNGFVGAILNQSCPNDGQVETLPIITVTGPLVNITIENTTYPTLPKLVLSGLNLGSGQKVEIDFQQGWLHTPNTRDSKASFVNYSSSDFFSLQPGANNIRTTINGSSGSGAAVEIRYRHAYA